MPATLTRKPVRHAPFQVRLVNHVGLRTAFRVAHTALSGNEREMSTAHCTSVAVTAVQESTCRLRIAIAIWSCPASGASITGRDGNAIVSTPDGYSRSAGATANSEPTASGCTTSRLGRRRHSHRSVGHIRLMLPSAGSVKSP